VRAPAGHDRGQGRAGAAFRAREQRLTLYIGTSGWAYAEWRGSLYPERLPQARFLEHYGQALNACEINATFYRDPSPAAAARWAEAVPDRFRFAVKAHRRLAHRKSLSAGAGEVGEMLAPLSPLGAKLGCLLIQFPEFVERDDGALDLILSALPAGLPPVCEFHHASWDVQEVADYVADRGGTICVREEEGSAPVALPRGPLAYLRLKGMHYPDKSREALFDLLASEASGRDVYAFARHKAVPPDDPHTGLGLARWLLGRSAEG
jgi:uncharacterized protein YecE (DUF72 family)